MRLPTHQSVCGTSNAEFWTRTRTVSCIQLTTVFIKHFRFFVSRSIILSCDEISLSMTSDRKSTACCASKKYKACNVKMLKWKCALARVALQWRSCDSEEVDDYMFRVVLKMDSLTPGMRSPRNMAQLPRPTPLFQSMEELHEKLAQLLGKNYSRLRRYQPTIKIQIANCSTNLISIKTFEMWKLNLLTCFTTKIYNYFAEIPKR